MKCGIWRNWTITFWWEKACIDYILMPINNCNSFHLNDQKATYLVFRRFSATAGSAAGGLPAGCRSHAHTCRQSGATCPGPWWPSPGCSGQRRSHGPARRRLPPRPAGGTSPHPGHLAGRHGSWSGPGPSAPLGQTPRSGAAAVGLSTQCTVLAAF